MGFHVVHYRLHLLAFQQVQGEVAGQEDECKGELGAAEHVGMLFLIDHVT